MPYLAWFLFLFAKIPCKSCAWNHQKYCTKCHAEIFTCLWRFCTLVSVFGYRKVCCRCSICPNKFKGMISCWQTLKVFRFEGNDGRSSLWPYSSPDQPLLRPPLTTEFWNLTTSSDCKASICILCPWTASSIQNIIRYLSRFAVGWRCRCCCGWCCLVLRCSPVRIRCRGLLLPVPIWSRRWGWVGVGADLSPHWFRRMALLNAAMALSLSW